VDWTVKRKVAAAAAGVAVLAGAGGAYAVTKGSARGDRQAFLSDVAKRLNVTPQQLQSAFQGALSDRLAADVAAGRLTQQQADEIKQRAKDRGGVPFGPGRFGGGPPPFGPPGGPGGPGGGPLRAGLGAAATYLGLSDAQLRAQLQSGKSLAQVAGDRNKPVAGLKTAIEDAVKSELDKAVAAKRITAADEQQELSELHSRIDDIVNGKPGVPPGPPPPPGAPGFERGPYGFAPGGPGFRRGRYGFAPRPPGFRRRSHP
jgi:hypothetical protein